MASEETGITEARGEGWSDAGNQASLLRMQLPRTPTEGGLESKERQTYSLCLILGERFHVTGQFTKRHLCPTQPTCSPQSSLACGQQPPKVPGTICQPIQPPLALHLSRGGTTAVKGPVEMPGCLWLGKVGGRPVLSLESFDT